MSPSTILVTGANRGLGLAFVERYLANGQIVFAAVRQPKESKRLQELHRDHSDRLHLIALDTSSDESVVEGSQAIADHTNRLDIVIQNAGVYGSHRGSVYEEDASEILHTIDVNAVGSLRVVRSILPLLQKGNEKKLILMTSLMGSIADNGRGGSYGYRMSKAALNMLAKTLAIELSSDGITTVALHPGWVKTDMGGANAPMTIDDSIQQMMKTISALKTTDNGKFINFAGKELPW